MQSYHSVFNDAELEQDDTYDGNAGDDDNQGGADQLTILVNLSSPKDPVNSTMVPAST